MKNNKEKQMTIQSSNNSGKNETDHFQEDHLKIFETKIGYSFQDKSLL